MSVTFTSNIPSESTESTSVETCCLCAQGSEHWTMKAPEAQEAREDLKANANPSCPFCHGTGVEVEQEPVSPLPNYANGNASLILQALGFPCEETEMCGSASIPEFRRACVRALAKGNLKTREATEYRGKAKVVNGEIRRGVHIISGGIDQEGLTSRIQSLLDFAVSEQGKGATTIHWS